MVIQMLPGLHCVHAQFAFSGGSGEYLHTIVSIQDVVSDVLYDSRSLLAVDQRCRLSDKLLRVVLKLVKHLGPDALKNRNDSFPRQAGFIHQFSDQVIFYAAIGTSRYTVVCCPSLHKRTPGKQPAFGFNGIHGPGLHPEVNLWHAQLTVKRCDGLFNQLFRIKVNHIGRLCVNP